MKALLYRNIVILVYVLLLPLVGLGQNFYVTTLAGGNWHDGPALEAKFYLPSGTAFDAAGNLYVSELGNVRIRKISSNGVVTTVAGSGIQGYADDTGFAAIFTEPIDIACDGVGNLYVTDNRNHRIRKITPAGVVTTFAGSGISGYNDATGTAASFHSPRGLAVDRSGNIYVADAVNNRIRKISPLGVVTTLAGSGDSGFNDGDRTLATFYMPTGLAVDNVGNVYVADTYNHRIRKISPAGVVTTLAGGGNSGRDYGRYADGTGTSARFKNPSGLVVDGAGNVYVADQGNHCIRKISPIGEVTTLAGSVNEGYTDGFGIAASFASPSSLSLDEVGNVFVSDFGNHRIRKISPSGIVTTFAGSATNNYEFGASGYGIGGYVDGFRTAASFNNPIGLASDGAGFLYVADTYNHRIRKISPTGVVTTFAGSGNQDLADGTGITASFNTPTSLAIDSRGFIYVADCLNHRIRKISPEGVVTTLAGSGNYGFADGNGSDARFYEPNGITVDIVGNVYVADSRNYRIRKISPEGVVTTLAGSGSIGLNNGIGTFASFSDLNQLAVDILGNVYVSDFSINSIRKVSPEGVVSTLAGSGERGFTDGVGTAASFCNTTGVAVDVDGNVYVADGANHSIRKISPSGVVSTLAGSRSYGYADGVGSVARFGWPRNIAVDAIGNVYVADQENNAIRKISTTPTNVKKKSINAPRLKLFPNPTTGIVTLTTSPDAESIAFINAIGQLVFTTKAQPEMELNLSHLANGVYIVQVRSNKGGSTQRLVIQ